MDTSGWLPCPLCSEIALHPLGHRAATCRRGGDVVFCHTHLREILSTRTKRTGKPSGDIQSQPTPNAYTEHMGIEMYTRHHQTKRMREGLSQVLLAGDA